MVSNCCFPLTVCRKPVTMEIFSNARPFPLAYCLSPGYLKTLGKRKGWGRILIFFDFFLGLYGGFIWGVAGKEAVSSSPRVTERLISRVNNKAWFSGLYDYSLHKITQPMRWFHFNLKFGNESFLGKKTLFCLCWGSILVYSLCWYRKLPARAAFETDASDGLNAELVNDSRTATSPKAA